MGREGPSFRVTTVRKFATLRAAGCLVRLQLPHAPPSRQGMCLSPFRSGNVHEQIWDRARAVGPPPPPVSLLASGPCLPPGLGTTPHHPGVPGSRSRSPERPAWSHPKREGYCSDCPGPRQRTFSRQGDGPQGGGSVELPGGLEAQTVTTRVPRAAPSSAGRAFGGGSLELPLRGCTPLPLPRPRPCAGAIDGYGTRGSLRGLPGTAPGDCRLADPRGVRLALARAGLPALLVFAAFCRAPGGTWLGPRPRKARIPWATLLPSGLPPPPGLPGSSPTASGAGSLRASPWGAWARTATLGSCSTRGAGRPCSLAGTCDSAPW